MPIRRTVLSLCAAALLVPLAAAAAGKTEPAPRVVLVTSLGEITLELDA